MDDKVFALPTHLWPAEGHYLSGSAPALSIVALAIHLTLQEGNLALGTKGTYFFRDYAVPTPRPATILAWDALCRVGSDSSQHFILPFLPSIRADEEGGIAGSVKGAGDVGSIHLPSLTRRSRLHAKDADGRITWGAVYIGSLDPARIDPIIYELHRSDVPESYVLPRKWQNKDVSSRINGGLRYRMEFLAQHGIPAVNNSGLPIPKVGRGLFQFLSQEAARQWAFSYRESLARVQDDPDLAVADWHQMIHEFSERSKPGGVDDTDSEGFKKADSKRKGKPKFKFGETDF